MQFSTDKAIQFSFMSSFSELSESSTAYMYLGKTFSASGEMLSLHSTSFKNISSSSVLLYFGDIVDEAAQILHKKYNLWWWCMSGHFESKFLTRKIWVAIKKKLN